MLTLLKLPELVNEVTKTGPSLSSGLSSVKTSIVQLAPQLAGLVTVPDRLLPLIVRPLSPGRSAWSPRLPPPISAIPFCPLPLVVVRVIRLPVVPAPLMSTPLPVLLIKLLPSPALLPPIVLLEAALVILMPVGLPLIVLPLTTF